MYPPLKIRIRAKNWVPSVEAKNGGRTSGDTPFFDFGGFWTPPGGGPDPPQNPIFGGFEGCRGGLGPFPGVPRVQILNSPDVQDSDGDTGR